MTERPSPRRRPINELIENSSLGTDGARRLRSRVSDQDAQDTREIAELRLAVENRGDLSAWVRLGDLLDSRGDHSGAAWIHRTLGKTALGELARFLERAGDSAGATEARTRALTLNRRDDVNWLASPHIMVPGPRRGEDWSSPAQADQLRWIAYSALQRLASVYAHAGLDDIAERWKNRAQTIVPKDWLTSEAPEAVRAVRQLTNGNHKVGHTAHHAKDTPRSLDSLEIRMKSSADAEEPNDDTSRIEEAVTVVIAESRDNAAHEVRTWCEAEPSIHLVDGDGRLVDVWTGPGAIAEVVILDLGQSLADTNLRELRRLVEAGRRVVVYNQEADQRTATQCIATGALSYITRFDRDEHLISAVHTAAQGDTYTPQSLSSSAIDGESGKPQLTEREAAVLRAWLACSSKKLAAERLGLGARAVDSYITRVRMRYAAVGRAAPSKSALIARALEDGLITHAELNHDRGGQRQPVPEEV